MNASTTVTRRVEYNDAVVRAFLLASLIFGVVGLLLGVIIASQLSFWQANLGLQWTTFGRLRPLHTNAAIFAFVGNMMFAGIYHSMQRLLRTRLGSDALTWAHFIGWQLIIVCAAVSLPLGLSQGKEYAELIWPIDVMVAVVWVIFAINFFLTIGKRNEKNLYVAIWFYIATVVTIPVLYIVNNLQIPTSILHSYPVFGGVQDALVQWWYGHNAVAFFLTTPILGIMYYYLPKAVGRPVYSYRLSVVHFWSLVFLYIWAGPHHLLNSALPEWAQTLGMVFSVMLWAPSWGGMLNGLLTLRGAWNTLRTDPVVKFLIVGVTFYGMSTFEGPLLSIKSVNALGHYTDWIIGHVHGGALGWNAGMAAGMFYWLFPRMWGTKLWSTKLADAHFWLSTFGMLLYIGAMWVAGVNQGLFFQALDAEGFLKNTDFVEVLNGGQFLYLMRLIGGVAFFSGYLMMVVNLVMTVRAGTAVNESVDVPVHEEGPAAPVLALIFSAPVMLTVIVVAASVAFGLAGPITSAVVAAIGALLVVVCMMYYRRYQEQKVRWHALLEGRTFLFTVLVLIAILVGGLIEIVPTVVNKDYGAVTASANKPEMVATPSKYLQVPYTPLELEGRDIYVREGCYVCHSQMVRPFRHETLRYGDYSRAESFVYDHPYQWGSKRTGPDLHRLAGRYPNLWHFQHMRDPRSTSPGSIMPVYAWLHEQTVDFAATPKKLSVMRTLGVPYEQQTIDDAKELALAQGRLIAEDLKKTGGVDIAPDKEIVALIAYLQQLGLLHEPPPLAQAVEVK
ncbi:MAG: cytochrome-c oxidase, cbb3-type subunit I [Planctomycetes bacterium]|nr:cytochrome-c oxidase, cbb3-type subunit I [Planctomycetota bacterium]